MDCQNCGLTIEGGSNFCGNCGKAIKAEPMNRVNKAYVTVDGAGNITINSGNLAEYRLALKELRLMKREAANNKRLLMEEKRQIRARYTEKVRNPGFWGYNKYSRTANRIGLAQDLRPLELQQQLIEGYLITLHRAIIEVEGLIIRYR